jgi:hypothetical protein
MSFASWDEPSGRGSVIRSSPNAHGGTKTECDRETCGFVVECGCFCPRLSGKVVTVTVARWSRACVGRR